MLAGGGSFGAIQVGMMHSLAKHGVVADLVVGSSVGAINGAYYAGDPSLKGVLGLEAVWRGLKRHDVFPVTWRSLAGFMWRRDFLIPHDGIRKLVEDRLPYRNLEDAALPVHIVTTDFVSGDSVVLSEGPAVEAILASTAIPGAFTPVHYRNRFLADGAISSNTPVRVAVAKGAKRLVVLPTGHACAVEHPPGGGRRQRAACTDAADRAAAGGGARRAGVRHRICRGATALSAGRVTLRFLAHRRAHRARYREHRCLADAGWSRAARRHPARGPATQSLICHFI
ncbi:patatin-like phospholipase family protein [Bradyrhizobium sp. NAS80.1]|uniref:patatin-like phospholipase family protein n=1 Tax=Bradyrhizobium sp. NAS80.1 TaxID=1680159 RepID=UPI001FD88574|nr:patatin-like phospholipase family protein [Bradyrhizobium sp. NAS80.1]